MAAKGLTPWAEREARQGERRMPSGRGKCHGEYPRGRGESAWGEESVARERTVSRCQVVPREEIRSQEKGRRQGSTGWDNAGKCEY